MADIIQLRKDSAANWVDANPVLADGEIGYEKDTRRFKVGNGINAWTSLPYWIGEAGAPGASLAPGPGFKVIGDEIRYDFGSLTRA